MAAKVRCDASRLTEEPKVRGEPTWPVDARGGRVVFVSHCLLNENVRYPGGATRAGAVAEVVESCLQSGAGICQMPCPEQVAWGGVRKRYVLWLADFPPLQRRMARRLLVTVGLCWTRVRYRRLARRVAGDVAANIAAGVEVIEIVGVGASPSCGVTNTLDVEAALAAMSARARCPTEPAVFNRDVVLANVRPGSGLFIEALARALRRRNLTVRFVEHDLVAELDSAASARR